MEKTINKKDLKPLIRETIAEMIRDNNDDIKELIYEAIEDRALANAVKDGRKNDYVAEKQIMKILNK